MNACRPNNWVWQALAMVLVTSSTLRAESALPMLRPSALRPGDRIMLVAPAGPPEEAAIRRAQAKLTELGFEVQLSPNLFERHAYLAGSDVERANALMEAFLDDSVRAIFAAKGGFGTTRILDRLDYDQIRQHPKIVLGFSDITALHIALQQRAGLVTFHGPNADSAFGANEGLGEFTQQWFTRALLERSYPRDALGNFLTQGYDLPTQAIAPSQPGVEPATPPLHGLRHDAQPPSSTTSGRLTGGNLTVIHALMGTPYEIETRDRVLFLEDVGEAPYRIDRMLSTLRLAGKLDPLRAVVLGQFTRRAEEDTSAETRTIAEVLDDYFLPLHIPIIKGFHAGHVRDNVTLPLGVLVTVDAAGNRLSLQENPVQ